MILSNQLRTFGLHLCYPQTVFRHIDVLTPLAAPTDKEARPYLRPTDCLHAAGLIAVVVT